jgi:hypothetical protein
MITPRRVLYTAKGKRVYVSARLLGRLAEALAEIGPATRDELAEHMGQTPGSLIAAVRMMRAGVVPYQRVRIAKFIPPEKRGSHKGAYSFGNAYDAKKRHKDKPTQQRAYRQKYGAVINARKRRQRSGTLPGFFDGLMP